jgi:hypothetical protein
MVVYNIECEDKSYMPKWGAWTQINFLNEA